MPFLRPHSHNFNFTREDLWKPEIQDQEVESPEQVPRPVDVISRSFLQ